MAGKPSRTKREFKQKLKQCTLRGISNAFIGKDDYRQTDRSRRSKPHGFVRNPRSTFDR